MKILFVACGNSKNFTISPFIKSQGDSLMNAGIEVQYFLIKGKGIFGYLKNALILRKYIKSHPIDIIHAHYTFSGWSSVLSFSRKPIVLSLMGSDAYGQHIGENKITFRSRFLAALTYLIQPFVEAIICKSKHIESFVYFKKKSFVIPNGILLDQIEFNQAGFRDELGINQNHKTVLFLGDKFDLRKNFSLVKEAVRLLDIDSVKLIAPYPISHGDVVRYLNSVDVLAVPSFMEGSPNVVKEAMACNCPIVGTDVGDIRDVISKTEGCFIGSFKVEEFAAQLKLALQFGKRTQGRERIVDLGLDSETIANKIIDVYKQILTKRVHRRERG